MQTSIVKYLKKQIIDETLMLILSYFIENMNIYLQENELETLKELKKNLDSKYLVNFISS